MSIPTDLCHIIGEYAASARYATLGDDAIRGAKMSIIDTLGVCLAASGMEPAARGVIDLVKASGGREESSIIGFGGKVPAVMAAFANGALAHCLDYDDQTPWGQHSASSLIPAVFAVSERVGGVSGEKMITSVAVGQDLFNRFRRTVHWQKDWMFTTVMGVFCATAASGIVLGLSAGQIANGLGIASMQCSGSAEVVNSTGSDLRALYAGFPAKGAVLSALLAERGVGGLPRLFEGPFGIMNLYFAGGYDRDKIIDGLGVNYTGGLTLYKRWPAVGTSHSHIHATIGIMSEHDLKGDDIVEIRLHVGDYHRLMCDPLDRRSAPDTLVDAKFSLPFLVAVASVRRDVRLVDFSNDAIHDPEVLATARKIVLVPDSTLDWKLDLPPGRVEIVTRDGRAFSKVGTGIPGSAEKPMTWEDIARKFDDCARSAVKPFTGLEIQKLVAMGRNLESLADATDVLRAAS